MPDPVFLSLVFQVAYPQNQSEYNSEKRTLNSARTTRHPHEKKQIHTQPYNFHTHTYTHTHAHTHKKFKKKKLKMAYRPKCKTIKALEDDIAGKGRLSKIYK